MADKIQINVTRDAYEAGIDRDDLIAAMNSAATEMGVEIEYVTGEPEFHPRWQELHDTARREI